MEVSISGTWMGKADPDGKGLSREWFFKPEVTTTIDSWEETLVPSCWNCNPRYERYEGIFWYRREFDVPGDLQVHDIFLKFNAANYLCRVWVNGFEMGTHEGGYLPFEFEIPANILKPTDNFIIVMVENFRAPDRIPGELCDWFNYGGIIRDVYLRILKKKRIENVKVTSRLIENRTASELSISWSRKGEFPFEWNLMDADGAVAASGREEQPGASGMISAVVNEPRLWSPVNPHLYTLKLTPSTGDAEGFTCRTGLREITIDGTKLLLNGEQIKMLGVSLHEEMVPHGRSIPAEERRREVEDIKAMGFNALRTAHYTHDEAILDAADEIGLLVLEEIPVYWDLDFGNEKLRATAASMVRDMINRGFNHPCVIQWSVGNEVPVENSDCDSLMKELMTLARGTDPSRPATFVSSRFVIDKTRRSSDICCLNCYVGWYFGTEQMLEGILEAARTTAPDKPWMITEFGAGAKAGFRGSSLKFTEERQQEILSHYIRTLNGMDWISGWFIWIYRDFKSPIRTNRYQKGFNRKGLVSERGKKKMICDMFPALATQKYDVPGMKVSSKVVSAMKFAEKRLYKLVQPGVAAAQKKMYNRFYSGKPTSVMSLLK